MNSENKLAFIETAMQCVILKSLYPNIRNLDVFFIKRKKWPADVQLLIKYLKKKNTETNGIFYALFRLIKSGKKYNHIIVGSHLGVGNRLLILLGIFLNYNVTVLDDGLYSVFFKGWMNTISRFSQKLKWMTYYNRDSSKNFIVNYCLVSNEKKYFYKNSYFLILSDMMGRGVSENREKFILNKIKNYAVRDNKQLILIPHRRGRFNLYRKLKLNILVSEEICFEDWYLKSKFTKNCRFFSSGSSIWKIFEDKRVKTTLINAGEGGNVNWIKENCYVDECINLY